MLMIFARALWLSFVTSVLVTIPLAFILTAYNLGFSSGFVHAYLVNSVIALLVSTVASLGAAPLARRIVGMHRRAPLQHRDRGSSSPLIGDEH